MTQDQLKTLLRMKFISRRYVANATGMSLTAVHLFVSNEARKMTAENWNRFLSKMETDKIKLLFGG